MDIKKEITKPLIIIALIIVFCMVLVRALTGGQTVSEYALQHPEQQKVESVAETTEPIQEEKDK